MPKVEKLPVVIALTTGTSPDGKHTALFFKIDAGLVAVAVDNSDLSRLAALLIEQAGKVAAQRIPEQPPAQMTSTPILASHVVTGKGRSRSEAFVCFRVGNLDLTFA